MNSDFEKFLEFIKEFTSGRESFETSGGKSLVQLCNEHADSHTNGNIGEKNIVAVHPYYDELEWRRWDDEHILERERPPQIKRLEKVLRSADRGKYQRVLFESWLNYAHRTHQLVEEGIIDMVVFTKIDEHGSSGVPVNHIDFSSTDVNYFGGAYGYQCVHDAMGVVARQTFPYRTRPIRDAILYHKPPFSWKVEALLSGGNTVIEGHSNISFNTPAKLHCLLYGVNSGKFIR